MADRLEANYIAPHLAPTSRETSLKGRRSFASVADGTSIENCHKVLHAYVAAFEDGHLFVMEQPKVSDVHANDLASGARRYPRSEVSLRDDLRRSGARRDPIEGIWTATMGQRFGVFRDALGAPGDFVGVYLAGAPEGWENGHVKAEFHRLDDGSYDVTLYDRKHFPRHPFVYLRGQKGGAALRRGGDFLHMPPTTWGRAFPTAGRVPIDAADPRHPTLSYPDSNTVLIAVPSHSPEHAAALTGLVERAQPRLATARTLIIDFRGNEGGSSGTTNVLAPFLISAIKDTKTPPDPGDPAVLSSPDNITYFARAQSQGWVPKGLLERLREAPGRVVPFLDAPKPTSPPPSIPPEAVRPHPQNVAILVDGAAVSAAEAALLQARPFSKVTIFGSPTGGVIDYQSVNTVRVSECGVHGFALGYPIMAGSMGLPKGGYKGTGILPDVPIPTKASDPIRFIVDYYERQSVAPNPREE